MNRSRTFRHVWCLVALLAASRSVAAGGEDDDRGSPAESERTVAPGDVDSPGRTPIDVLLADGDGESAEQADLGLAFVGRVLATAAATLIVLAGVVVLYKRSRPDLRRRAGSAGAQVLDRIPLTPRHSIHVVRVRDRMLVVGVSSDRITPLIDWLDAPPGIDSGAADGARDAAPEALGGIVAAASAGERPSAGETVPSTDPEFRSLLESWRQVVSDVPRDWPRGRKER